MASAEGKEYMLEKLDSVDWTGLKHPEMPAALRNLLSDNAETREEGYNALYTAYIDEVSLITPFVLPFLIEMVKSDTTPEKDSILLLLMQIYSYSYMAYKADISTETVLLLLIEIEQSIDAYLPFLYINDLSWITLELLGQMRRTATAIIPVLISIIHDEKMKIHHSHALGCLRNLVKDNELISGTSEYEDALFCLSKAKPLND
jgi:hypothetical protein